jgi:hypothetical protein
LSDKQRRRRAKDPATRRADLRRAAGRVASQLQSATAILFRRALPGGRHSSARLVPIYETGSKQTAYQHNPLLINSLAAFNFRRPLIPEFASERLVRASGFSQ